MNGYPHFHVSLALRSPDGSALTERDISTKMIEHLSSAYERLDVVTTSGNDIKQIKKQGKTFGIKSRKKTHEDCVSSLEYVLKNHAHREAHYKLLLAKAELMNTPSPINNHHYRHDTSPIKLIVCPFEDVLSMFRGLKKMTMQLPSSHHLLPPPPISRTDIKLAKNGRQEEDGESPINMLIAYITKYMEDNSLAIQVTKEGSKYYNSGYVLERVENTLSSWTLFKPKDGTVYDDIYGKVINIKAVRSSRKISKDISSAKNDVGLIFQSCPQDFPHVVLDRYHIEYPDFYITTTNPIKLLLPIVDHLLVVYLVQILSSLNQRVISKTML
jgi:hypothetical protein